MGDPGVDGAMLGSTSCLGTVVIASLLVGAGVSGCTPAPGDLDLEESDVSMPSEAWVAYGDDPEAALAVRSEPESEPEGQPGAGPHFVVTSLDEGADTEFGLADGTARCGFDVVAHGFPAVSEDGSTVVYEVAEVLSSSDGEDELVTVRWLDVASDSIDETIVIIDGEEFPEDDRCRRLWKAARERVAEVNEKLAARSWHTMQHVAVATAWGYGEPDDFREQLLARPPSKRPVELVYRNREAILRIPGVEVLGRRVADWEVEDEDPCEFTPVVNAVFVDQATGVAVAQVEQRSGPCFCYAQTLFHALEPGPHGLRAMQERSSHVEEAGC